MRHARSIATGLAVILICSVSYAGASPRAQLEAFFDRATLIVRDATSAQQARDDVRDLARGLFDGRRAAQRALGDTWDERTAAEREDFARVFGQVLERGYLEIVQARLPRNRPPTIHILEDRATGGAAAAAVVRTRVEARDSDDVHLDYLMSRSGGQWLIHDILVDGISLVDNYRAQFAQVLRRSSYAELMGRMRAVADMDVRQDAASLRRHGVRPDVVVAYFDPSGVDIGPLTRQELRKTAAWLAIDERARVTVEGHSDQRGDAKLNEAVAARRADAIREQLVRLGVPAERIETVAYGDRRPMCRQSLEDCWAQNRRAVVRVTP